MAKSRRNTKKLETVCFLPPAKKWILRMLVVHYLASVKTLSLQEECPANWFVKMRECVRRETGREVPPFSQSRQVKCAVRLRQWSPPFTCKDEVYGVSRVLWPVFRLQLRGNKAWRYPLPFMPPTFPPYLMPSPPRFLPSLPSTLHVFLLSLHPCFRPSSHLSLHVRTVWPKEHCRICPMRDLHLPFY